MLLKQRRRENKVTVILLPVKNALLCHIYNLNKVFGRIGITIEKNDTASLLLSLEAVFHKN